MKLKYFILLCVLFIGVILNSGCIEEETSLNCVNFDEFKGNVSDDYYKIYLTARQFIPPEGIECSLLNKLDSYKNNKIHIIIQFQDTPKQSERSELTDYNLSLDDYIHNKAYFASVPANKDDIEKIVNLSFVRWIGDILSEDKISKYTREGQIDEWAINENGTINLIVWFFRDVSLDDAEQIIKNHEGIVNDRIKSINALVVAISQDAMTEMVNEDCVQFIEQVPPSPINEHYIDLG